MIPELQKNLENLAAFDMLRELKVMFEQQPEQKLFDTVRSFHACKQEEGQSVKKGMPKKAPVVLAINKGRIQKKNKGKPLAPSKDKGKARLSLLMPPNLKFPHLPRRSTQQRTQSATTVEWSGIGGATVMPTWKDCRRTKLAALAHQNFSKRLVSSDASESYTQRGSCDKSSSESEEEEEGKGADASLAQKTPSPKATHVATSKTKVQAPIVTQRRKRRQYLNKDAPIVDSVIQLDSSKGGDSTDIDSSGIGVSTSTVVPAETAESVPTEDIIMDFADQPSAKVDSVAASTDADTSNISADATPITIPADEALPMVSADPPTVFVDPPASSISTGNAKDKAVMIEESLPSRVKSKTELELEELSARVAADLTEQELAAETKRQEELKLSEIVARRLQENLNTSDSDSLPDEVSPSSASQPSVTAEGAQSASAYEVPKADSVPPEPSISVEQSIPPQETATTEDDIKGESKASSSAANVSFVGKGKTSTNKVNSVSFITGSYTSSSSSMRERDVPAGFADEKRQLKEQRERERKNKPLTNGEQREWMTNYVKSQGEGWKLHQLRRLTHDQLKSEFEKCVKHVNRFIPMDYELKASSLKRHGSTLQSESDKRQKVEDVVKKEEGVPKPIIK
ncbi:hypothetical protein CTI12_AA225170 [Artemisia annua]|uniref:Uncharacterized protein n=1 Tax=Artemisia annua TaxID=35608 RepID=A0A2U1NV60_ARTAN|nr:hypothetical protein CTI12_AA225170 [Artemisia annua]